MEKKKNTPKLRFPEFTGEWEEKKLGEIAEILSGYPLKGDDILEVKLGTQILRGINITEGYIRHNDEIDRFYNGKLNKLEKYLLKEGDLVIGMDGSKVGKNVALISKLDDNSLLIQRVARIRASSKTIVEFIFQQIYSIRFQTYVNVVNTSSAIPHISIQQIEDYIINFPSLAEQTKIATFLTAVDEKLTQLKKKKTLLEQYKKGVMQKMFSQELRFKDDNNQDFPDWQEKTLGEVGEFIGGGTPSTKNNEYWNGNIPWISSSDLTEESIVSINMTRFISEEAVLKSATKLVPVNSVLIVSRVGVGKVAVTNSPLCTSQDFINLVPLNQNSIFLAYLIKLKTDNLLGFNQGTSIKGFVKSDLESLKLLIPSLPEQQKIANFLSAIDEKISHCSAQIEKMEAWKKGLLQQMFI